MKPVKKLILAGIILSITILSGYVIQKQFVLKDQKVGTQPDGSILVPTNQLLRPAGHQIYLPGRPVDLVLSPDERLLFVKNRLDIDIVRVQDRTVLQSLPFRPGGASFTGICLSPDGRKVYVTDARNRICIAELDANNIMKWGEPVTLPAPPVGGDPVPGGLALNSAGDRIWVTLTRNNSIAEVSLNDNSVTEIPVGMVPYDILQVSDEKAYVTNWGGRVPEKGETTYNSSGSQVLVDPKTGVANSGTVSVIDLKMKVQRKVIETGLHPSGMALSPGKEKLYVACANSDLVYVIDTQKDEVVQQISVHFQKDIPFGSSPNALAVSPDGNYLYVANGTENAICVIQISTSQIMGYIPVGWYPGSVITDRKGERLFVANVKGTGSRNQRTDRKGYNSHDHMGSVSIVTVPGEGKLAAMTEVVHQNNSFASMVKKPDLPKGKARKVPVPVLPGETSHFKHVVYIIKENRTYDQVFGDMEQGDGDTSLLEFGREISPNHHKLAETFVLMDNFNCSGVLSADGHQWTDEAFATDYIEKFFGGFNRSYPYDGDDAMAYASSGFIWDNVLRHGHTFRNYGEFVEAVTEPSNATFMDMLNDLNNGTNKVRISGRANIETIKPYICPSYPGFTNTIPDVYRAAEFLKELKEYEKNKNFPNFIIMLLPNDHTSGTRPGLPTPQAAVADNDLALGQIVEAISHSSFWKETCIFVTEDDPQAGLDHIDGHRTVGFVISPYTRRGQVVSTYYSQLNMVRTMENILGIPPMNQLDLTAEAMTDCFTNKPDYTPYKALKNNIPLDQLNQPLSELTGKQLYWALKSMEQDLDGVDRIDEDIFNRIIWHAVRGYETPYPAIPKGEIGSE